MKTVHVSLGWVFAMPSMALLACASHEVTNVPVAHVHPMMSAIKTMNAVHAPSALETRTGIQITHVGLTASGGLVDLRFKVLDTAKAKTLLGNPANTPMLVAGDMPPLMPPHHAMRGAKFAQDQVVYILYPNLRGAIKPGVEVVVAMGDVRFGPVLAQ
jgi:hypothetical protein